MSCNNWGPQLITETVISGRPFQARYQQISTRKTADGQASQEILSGAVFRDNDGRIRKELRLPGAPDEVIQIVLLADPANESIHVLDLQSKTFLKERFPAALKETRHELPFATKEDLSEEDGEALGERELEGLICHGHRSHLGDDVVEFWYSDDLREVLLEKRTSRDEENTLRLFEIHRVEPDSELFSIPAGYSPVNEAQPGVASYNERSAKDVEKEDGAAFLNFAAASGDIESVRSQLAEGVYVNAKGYCDETALMAAAECGQAAIVEELLRAGAEVDLRSKTGATALMLASMNGHAEIVRSLLAAGARTDMEAGRQTALMFAALNGSLTSVELLLAAGANANAKESHNMTALMWAAERGHLEIVKALLASNADVHAKNVDGYTAIDIARMVNQTKIVSLLAETDSPK